MKKLLFILVCLTSMSFIEWQTDFENAKKIAKEKHRLILLNFSGSDWCGPCIRMRKEILGNENFSKMADSSLVLVNADFPRNKKNQPDKIIRKQNETGPVYGFESVGSIIGGLLSGLLFIFVFSSIESLLVLMILNGLILLLVSRRNLMKKFHE